MVFLKLQQIKKVAAYIFLHSVFLDNKILIIPVPVPISNIVLSFFISFENRLLYKPGSATMSRTSEIEVLEKG